MTIVTVSPRIGGAATLVIDHFGVFGVKVIPANAGRVAGVVLIVVGVVMAFRR